MRKQSLIILVMSVMVICSSQSGYSTELETAFIMGSYPRFYVDEQNGKEQMAGLCIDIMKKVEQAAPEIQFSYKVGLTPFARIKEQLKKNQIQAAFGVARNPQREKIYQYTDTPLYPVKFVVFALKSDEKAQGIKTFEDIKNHGGTMLGLRGTNAIETFRKKTEHLNIPIEVVSKMEQNIKKVVKGRGSFFTYNHIDAIGAIKRLGHQDKFVILPVTTKETHHWLAFSKEVPREIVEKANKVLSDMEKSGELQEIYNKYM